ncbi:Cbb3-type cytochrome c oxidase subunit CcoP [Sterolibacterium denitrificans]|uniref:Cbb3-type cytochrome c oxidase subunit n=1 Tax=Sterolibacterium denitrificans TaxID=157592 RepID=A0A7Z7HS65_9PROT|nr:cytochrome-c oxidase, cbb3-type subunit III [Sterolibacterium denitrificans]SMB27609.1 Cbb3-type cytochrome c oxidase subunit CcoP [Sterolibacterium denitrificans]
MSQDFSGFWNIYIVLIVLVSVLACAVLLWVQDRAQTTPGKTTGHLWDESLEEYNNPLPNWWRWLYYLTVIFSLVYLALYPGLGHFAGIFGWTSQNQYEKEMAAAKAQYDPIYEAFQKQDVVTLAGDAHAREMGKTLFLTYCAQCHGSDAKGAKGFPNLTDGDWLYGGTPEAIRTTILDGRNGMMPAYGGNPDAVGGASGAREVANYVRSLSGLANDSILAAKGKVRFEAACTACHGADGKGNQMLGAPNLTDKVWLYGSREEVIVETITKGRSNQMPEHRERLGEAKVHLLTAYVYGLGGGVAPAEEEQTAADSMDAGAADAPAAPEAGE